MKNVEPDSPVKSTMPGKEAEQERADSVLLRLRTDNPFISSASPPPWENSTPDLASLNSTAFVEIEQLLRNKRSAPSVPIAGLILGGAGVGKTHMLMRLLRRLRENNQTAVFATVLAFLDPDSAMRHLWSEIVVSLSHENSRGQSQLDMLMNELDTAYRERCNETGRTARGGMDRLADLRAWMRGINKDFLKCLLLYSACSDSEKSKKANQNDIQIMKMDLLDWLQNGLDDEDAARLGLPARDLDSMTVAAREDDARNMLLSLGHVLSFAKVPMMVCFDQLDGMDSAELINAWGRALSFLVNSLAGVLPLAFLREDTWNKLFAVTLDNAVVQRLTPHIVMRNCSLEQAKRLIHSRLSAFFKDEQDVETAFQWLMSSLGEQLKEGYSPRIVIELAKRAIQNTPQTDESVLKGTYLEECKKIVSAPNDWPPRAGRLLLALRTWLDGHSEFSVSPCQDKKYICLAGKRMVRGERRECAFIVLTPSHSATASAALKRGIAFLKEHPGGFCCYITDARSHKGPNRWRQVGAFTEEFKALGGHMLILGAKEQAC